eukprot:4167407-Prymnesium_polylepis.1
MSSVRNLVMSESSYRGGDEEGKGRTRTRGERGRAMMAPHLGVKGWSLVAGWRRVRVRVGGGVGRAPVGRARVKGSGPKFAFG